MPAKRTLPPRVVIPRQQRHLPVGFHETSGRQATLREVISPTIPTIDGDRLTLDQKAALTVKRIARQKHFELLTRHGRIGKRRAIQEVKRQSPLGLAIIDLEHTVIQIVSEEAARRRQSRRRRRIRP